MTNQEAIKTFLTLTQAVVEAVAAAGPDGLPEGHLYAAMMGKVTLESFKDLVRTAIRGGCIARLGQRLIADADIRAAFEARQTAGRV